MSDLDNYIVKCLKDPEFRKEWEQNGEKVIAINTEGIEVEGEVVYERKAEYEKPKFAVRRRNN